MPHLAIKIIESVFRWIDKITKMPDDRLPKICLNRLLYLRKLESSKIDEKKYNWCVQIENIFKPMNMEVDWDILSLKNYRDNLTTEYKQRLYQTDLERAQASSSLLIFPHLVLRKGSQKY